MQTLTGQLVMGDESGQALVEVDPHAEQRQRVRDAFAGFIGNEQAVHDLQRVLLTALIREPTALGKNLLLTGSASTGKTELARRCAGTLALPFVSIDGKSVKTRERLFELIDLAIKAHGTTDAAGEPRAGIMTRVYPPFVVFVDEVHLVKDSTQEALLTLLEPRDRTVLLEHKESRRYAYCPHAGFILATTKPSLVDNPLRSRCSEIKLARYTVEQVAQMVQAKYPAITPELLPLIAKCARLIPRRAFDLASDILDEQALSRCTVVTAAHQVMRSRGIVATNGVDSRDMQYLNLLIRENRPLGLGMIVNALGLLERDELTEDIEPYLVHELKLATMTQYGRAITPKGRDFVREVAQQRQQSRD